MLLMLINLFLADACTSIQQDVVFLHSVLITENDGDEDDAEDDAAASHNKASFTLKHLVFFCLNLI